MKLKFILTSLFCLITAFAHAQLITPAGDPGVCVSYTVHFRFTGGPTGTWSSGDTSIATIDSSGTTTGISGGDVMISYTNVTHTYAQILHVHALPNAGTITGMPGFCTGSNTMLADTAAGGRWSSSDTAIATVDSLTGILTGVSSGADIITYSVRGEFCPVAITTADLYVMPLPAPGTISGASSVYTGASTTLSETVAGGMWSVSDGAKAAISSSGVVTGISAGTVIVSYTVTNTCGSSAATQTLTVGAPFTDHAPSFVYGAAISVGVCYSSTADISSIMRIADADSGQTERWMLVSGPHHGSFTGFPYRATSTGAIVIPAGLVYSPASGFSGLDSFTIMVSDGNAAAYIHISINVKPLPAVALTGGILACMGHNDTLAGTPAGGAWTNTYTSVGSLSSAGVFTPLAPGTATIKYTVTGSNGCTNYRLDTITVRNAPVASAIAGAATVCTGIPTTFTDGVSGGTWGASNSNAAVSSTGVVTGTVNGHDTITYTINNGCGIASSAKAITVGATAGSISGPSEVCTGSYITLTDAVTGGTWGSSNTGVATVSAGRVTGVASGIVVISYGVSSSCGIMYATDTVTVNTVAIGGSLSACAGRADMLTGTPAGGTWFSSSDAVATISASGVVTAIAPGTTSIKYTMAATGCNSYVLSSLTVHANPASADITGASAVCTGSSITLADATPGGTWSATNGNATASAGHVVGAMAGMDTILYTLTNSYGCTTAKQAVMTVNNCGAAKAANQHGAATTAQAAADAQAIKVYPNPATGIFTVVVPADEASAVITIYDLNGRQAAQQTVSDNSGSATFDFTSFARGTYLVKVQGAAQVWNEKVVIH